MQFLSPIVGSHFRDQDGRNAFNMVSLGDTFTLEREPDNKYDPNAIKVLDRNGTWIGYIAAEVAADLAPFLDGRGTATGDAATVTRCQCIDTTNQRKPGLVIEITTGFEVNTTVEQAAPANSTEEASPDEA